MGNPVHYSLDLPTRCLHLLNELHPFASKMFMPGADEELGSLTATLTLTMAIPIITLPYERLYNLKDDDFNYADDRQLNMDLTDAVKADMKLARLSQTPFFRPNVWRFIKVDGDNLFKLGDGLPHEIAQDLAKQDAIKNADNML